MSQDPSLNSLCCENVNGNDTFNNLYTKFCEEHDYHEKTKILNLLVQAYLLHFKVKEGTKEKTDERIELLSRVPDLCCSFLQPSLNDETETFQNLASKKENLESAGLCFDLMLACLEIFCETHQGLIIMKISLNILCQGYNHCKESEAIYGELLEEFSNQLGFFFKKIETLQIVVLQQLENLDIKKIPSDNLHINSIIWEMGNLCEVVFSLDADIAFELWSKYIRIVTDHGSLKQISNINSISTYLALKNIEVLEIMKFNADKNSEEDEELYAKFFFYFDALSSLLKLVPDSFKENISQFRTFLLNLFDCLVLSYSHFIEKSGMNIVKNSLQKNIFTFLSYLYRDEEFLNSVLSVAPDKENLISIYLLKLCALQFMECASLQLKENTLKDIFSNFLSASFEDDMKLLYISIPLCIVTEKSSRSVTLYQFAYEQLAEFSKGLPNSVINKLGNTIIDFLLSSSDIFYLLISDVWIYRLRCSSIDFLKAQCSSLIQYCSEKNFKSIKIDNVTKRMLRFLPHSHKEELLRECRNLKLILDDKSIEHRYCIPDLSSTEAEISIDSEEKLKRMVSMFSECSNNDASQLVQKSCICLELCASFVNISGNSEILLFSEFAAEMFKSGVYEIQIAVLTFIRALSRKKMQEHTQEFGKIVVCLAQLFSIAMNSKNYIVRYEARNVFSYFAKCTPHIKIVQETIRGDPSLKPALKAYISAVPDNDFLSAKAKSEYLRTQMPTSRDFHFEIPKPVVESLQVMFSRCNSLL